MGIYPVPAGYLAKFSFYEKKNKFHFTCWIVNDFCICLIMEL